MNRELDRGSRYMLIPLTRFLLVALFLTVAITNSAVAQNAPPELTPEGLQLVPSSGFAVAYVRPGVDFSGYTKLIILEPEVAFKRGWRRQHQQANINDMTRIRRELAELFRGIFIQELQNEGGYQVVNEAAEDVLLIRLAIVDLDVAAPILPGRGIYSFTTSAGAATLNLELLDSVSGELLAQAVDRQQDRYSSYISSPATRFSNRAAATRILAGWARILREDLDEVRN